MTVLVVYESMYGTTRTVAEAIADGLAPAGPVRVVEVGALAAAPGGRKIAADVALLVVGGPTHAFGMSRPTTRTDAPKYTTDGVIISTRGGIREWLDDVSLPIGGTRVATFDTRTSKPRLPGSAAKQAEKQLVQMGGRPIAPSRSFWVTGRVGLVEGEEEKARAFGAELAALLQPA